MPALEGLEYTTTGPVAPSAVVWVDHERAVVATIARDGWYATCEIDRGPEPEAAFLALVVHAIGDRERVMVVGTGTARLALEREYVAMAHHPDRIVDRDLGVVLDRPALIRQLRALAS